MEEEEGGETREEAPPTVGGDGVRARTSTTFIFDEAADKATEATDAMGSFVAADKDSLTEEERETLEAPPVGGDGVRARTSTTFRVDDDADEAKDIALGSVMAGLGRKS